MSTQTAPAKSAVKAAAKPAANKPVAPPAAKAAAPAAAKAAAPAAAKPAKAAEAAPPKATKPAAKAAKPAPEASEPSLDAGEAGPAPDAKKARHQLTGVLQIDISQARCATHLKQHLGDEQIEGKIRELRKDLKAAREAKDEAAEKNLKAEIAEQSKTLVRVSSETPIAAAVVMDCLVKELIRHGMDQAIAGDRKIVDVSHLHEGEVSDLLYYPLIYKLPAYAGYNAEHEEELRKERAATNKAAKEARETKKSAAGSKPDSRRAEAPQDAEDDEAAEQHTKTTFFTYVENALKAIKKDEPYRTMRVSNRVREYLSELVSEGIARLAELSRIIVQQIMNVRTMNADHIMAIVHILMADEGRREDQIAAVKAQIMDKIGVYHEHLRSEREKKASSVAEDKKADVERKRLEMDIQRKKKQTEFAKKRIIEATQRAETLAAETAKLEATVVNV